MTAMRFHCTGNGLRNSSADQASSPSMNDKHALPSREKKLNAQQFLLIQPLTVQVKPVLSSQEIQVERKIASTCARRRILMWDIFHTRYKIKSDQVFVPSHASVLKLGSEMTFISASPWYKKKTLCIIVFHTMQAIGT